MKQFNSTAKNRVLFNLRRGISPQNDVLQELTHLCSVAGFSVDFEVAKNEKNSAYSFALSIGGDGTFLETAEILHMSGNLATPIFGINFGHVGFLTSAESENAVAAVKKLLAGEFEVQNRSILRGVVKKNNSETEFWAINEVAVEKAGLEGDRFGMLNVRLEVDKEAVSRFGCDAMIVASPTGSTAHAFSAGGPIIWPEVDAMVVVPVAAHALFSRPLVIGASSELLIHVDETAAGFATLLTDGRRGFRVETGAEICVKLVKNGVNFALIKDEPFTKRLVQKFTLPVEGWR